MIRIVAMIHLIVMPVVMLAYFVLALSAPQLGLFNGQGLLIGGIASFFVAMPFSYFIAREISRKSAK